MASYRRNSPRGIVAEAEQRTQVCVVEEVVKGGRGVVHHHGCGDSITTIPSVTATTLGEGEPDHPSNIHTTRPPHHYPHHRNHQPQHHRITIDQTLAKEGCQGCSNILTSRRHRRGGESEKKDEQRFEVKVGVTRRDRKSVV